MREIRGKKSRDIYYYDEENLTISDKEGNTFKLYESLDNISDCNLQWYLDILFHKFYIISNDFKESCIFSKGDDTIWEEFK